MSDNTQTTKWRIATTHRSKRFSALSILAYDKQEPFLERFTEWQTKFELLRISRFPEEKGIHIFRFALPGSLSQLRSALAIYRIYKSWAIELLYIRIIIE